MAINLEKSLQVDGGAIEFWNMVNLLFPTESDKIVLEENCKDKSRRAIELYLLKTREQLLLCSEYSKDEFIEDYSEDKRSALERLFLQPMTIGMMSKFHGDPAKLYEIHSKNPKAWFIECVLEFV